MGGRTGKQPKPSDVFTTTAKYQLDPHTAVAWRACEKYRLVTSDDRYAVVVSTASPYKFSGSVYEAVKTAAKNYILFDALHKLHELTGVPVPEKNASA